MRPARRSSRVATSLALAALALPCAAHAQARARDAAATPTAAADAGRTPADEARRAQAIAHVGERTITVGEVEDMLNDAPPPVRQAYAEPSRRREFVENLISTMLLADEAQRRGIDRSPEVAANTRRILAQRLQQDAVLNAVTPDSISDADVRTYYEAHQSDYQQPEMRRATLVVTADRPTADQVAQQARAARGDMRRIQGLVRERSVDEATREHDGDLFYFRRPAQGVPSTTNGVPIDPAVIDAAFALPHEMDVSPPTRTADGKWAVVVLTGVRPGLSRTLADQGVVNSIRGYIVRQRRTEREHQLLQELRDRLHPETHPERLDLLQLPAADLGGVPPMGPPRRAPTSGASPLPRPIQRAPLAPSPVAPPPAQQQH